jgi:hypothetical protein
MERLDHVESALATVRVPLFLARITPSQRTPRIALHTTDRKSGASLRKQAESALRARGIVAACKVVVHRSAALARKKSLEAFNGAFADGETVFDPTGAISRSMAVVRAAGALRATLGVRLTGVFVDAERRALFVILDRSRFVGDSRSLLDQRVEAMRQVGEVMSVWRKAEPCSLELAVRIGFELPVGVGLIPVDRRSERMAGGHRTFLGRLRKPGIAATLASIVGVGSAAQALAADFTLGSTPGVLSQPEPAVAAPNIGLIGAGGWRDGDNVDGSGWGALGVSATLPLSEQFGGQIDAAVGSDSYAGVGGHLFWRDPNKGMLGVVGSYETSADATLSRVAVEGEIYRNDITVRGEVGAQSGTTANGAFGGLDLTFYANPNFSMTVGGELGSQSIARAVVEWQPASAGLSGLSLFADGEVGSNGYGRVLAGIKYYFGTHGASLKDRDRKYDPDFSLFNTQGLGYGYHAPAPI